MQRNKMKKIIQNAVAVFLAMIFSMAFAAKKNNREETNACVGTNTISNAADYNGSEGKIILTGIDPAFY